MTLLHHIRLPSAAPGFPTYARVVELQTYLQRRLLEHKAAVAAGIWSPSSPAPPPTLISFTPAPTYTLGRRQSGPLSPAEEQRLRAPLRVRVSEGQPPRSYAPEVVSAPRGGLATYHGPGQLVFWPIIDLHSPHYRHFTVRGYACLLEKTTKAALARVTKRRSAEIQGFTTSNPGVWVRHSSSGLLNTAEGAPTGAGAEERKIAALGVHLRRHVTGLGVAVNVDMPVSGPEESNPWSRIVACGLEDKGVTNVMTELYGASHGDEEHSYSSTGEQLQDELRQAWAEVFEERLRVNSKSLPEYKDGVIDTMISSFRQNV
ncbi:hypothetical protein KJ359_006245 [Pestalotiopsis sp. 9143b]|nr:hypothetical protein KJ359_006245 [Pestalotiopsis sp. 9143b]